MGRPQQPELARSGRTDLDPDRIGTELEARKPPETKGRTGPVPAENQPGHHPDQEADKPDLDEFAARLGAAEPAGRRLPAVVGVAGAGLRVAGRTLGGLQEWVALRWRRRG
jgi:hypothetical protein